VALGPNGGAAVERFGRESRDQRPRSRPGELCCDIDDFSLQAKVRIAADDRDGLERLCRYVTRLILVSLAAGTMIHAVTLERDCNHGKLNDVREPTRIFDPRPEHARQRLNSQRSR